MSNSSKRIETKRLDAIAAEDLAVFARDQFE